MIINDGSQDKTSRIAHRLAQKDSHIRVIDQENLGYGGALQRGFKEARYEWVFFADGDLQFDLKELHRFVPHTEHSKVIIGYRTHRADHWQRKLLASMLKIWNTIFFQFPIHIKDIDCAFKLIHTQVLKTVFPLESRGAMISTELLLKIFDQGYKATQIGVSHYPRLHGVQTGAKPHVINGAIKDTARLFFQRNLQSISESLLPSFNWIKSNNNSL